ncbi:MAG TPA: AAA family ATPase [Actinomycetota bacterium]|nr:AAA family ATPase [Actinomycetota bacterium]
MTATPPRLVGRDQPLAELQALVAAALASRGGLVTLTGEAGIGKTALATAAADHAEERGATVAWGACWEGAPPFWPWLEVLAALGARVDLQGGERLRPPSAAAARFERFSAVSGALLEAAGSRPLVVVLDDLHWADPASVELAAFHARRARRSRQLLVVTYRDVEVAPGDPLAGPLSRLAAEGGTLPLGGLDTRQVAVLLAAVTGGDPDPELGAGVRRRTGGNPFLVQQVARLLAAHPDAAAVPLGARDAIRRRLAALGDRRVRLLEAASVLGPDLNPAVLARMTGQPAGAVQGLLGEAATARVLVEPADELGPWRFAHDLFREVLYGQLDPEARGRLHLAAAEALESLRDGGSDVRPAELAGHYLRAVDQAGPLPPGAAAKAVDHCELAALEAAAVLADEDAARQYRQALRLASETGQRQPERRARLLAGLGEALRRSGDTTGARAAFGQAADLARRAGRDPALARAALGLHAIGVESGADPTDVAGLLEEALAGSGAAPALAAQLESALAQTLARTPAPDPAQAAALAGRAAAMADRAVATARATGDARVLAAALLGKHDVLWGPDTPRERLAVLAELEGLAAGDEELAAEAQLLRATALLELGEASATALLATFARRARGSHLARVRWLGRSREAMLAVLAGDLLLAERLSGEAEQLGEELQVPDAGHVAAGLRAGVDSLRGRPSPALLEAAERLVARVAIPVTSPRAWMTMLLRGRERPAWVDAYARAALEVAPDDVPRDWMWTRSAVILAELNADLGRDQACARWYEALAPYQARTAVAGGAVLFCGAVAHYLGLLAAATGRPDLARRHLEDAAAIHERLGARPWLLRSRLELARLLGDDPAHRDRAAELLEAVQAEAGRLGLEEVAAGAAGLLGERGRAGPAEFRRVGASWTVGYAGRVVRLPDAKGMRDLAVLLSRPGQPVPAAELVALSGGGRLARAGLALGADAILDDQAKRAYRRRLQDLDREVAEAEDQGDPERVEKARQERDAIAHELAAALGLGGRDRGLGDPAERARKAVTERIRYSMARIARAHPELAGHLEASVTTGSSCAYVAAEPVTWLT